LSSGKKIKGGLYEKSIGQNILEGLFYHSRRALVREIPVEVPVTVRGLR
jgi:hypothetical protein